MSISATMQQSAVEATKCLMSIASNVFLSSPDQEWAFQFLDNMEYLVGQIAKAQPRYDVFQKFLLYEIDDFTRMAEEKKISTEALGCLLETEVKLRSSLEYSGGEQPVISLYALKALHYVLIHGRMLTKESVPDVEIATFFDQARQFVGVIQDTGGRGGLFEAWLEKMVKAYNCPIAAVIYYEQRTDLL